MASGQTTNYDIPYPLPTDPVDVASDIQSLAEKIDTIINNETVHSDDISAKGDLFVGTANDTYGILNAGTNENRLVVDSGQSVGLKYVADTTNYAIAAKGDLLAGTAADTLQAVTVGSNGTTLLANSSATPGVSWSEVQVGKNFLINANCVIGERAVSATPTTSNSFVIDRFFVRRSSGSSGATASQASSIGLEGFSNAIRMTRTAGNTATDTLIVGQTVETLNSGVLQGKTVTFSFWARKGANYTAASDALLVRVYTGTGTNQTGLGSSYTGTATPISQTATLTTSWQRFSYTATLATDITQIQPTVQYVPVGTASANDNFDITGLQLEVGSVATPFVLAGGGSYQAELNLCRRYYERWTTGSLSRIGNGFAVSGTNTRITMYFKVTKRVAPNTSDSLNLEIVRSATNISYVLTSYSVAATGVDAATISGTASTGIFTTGEFVELRGTNAGSYLGWDSEIS